jgi:hypothetical protein
VESVPAAYSRRQEAKRKVRGQAIDHIPKASMRVARQPFELGHSRAAPLATFPPVLPHQKEVRHAIGGLVSHVVSLS